MNLQAVQAQTKLANTASERYESALMAFHVHLRRGERTGQEKERLAAVAALECWLDAMMAADFLSRQ